MSTEAQKRASRKYDDQNTQRIYIKLNKKQDADILEWMEKIENKQGYIKALIRADIAKQ